MKEQPWVEHYLGTIMKNECERLSGLVVLRLVGWMDIRLQIVCKFKFYVSKNTTSRAVLRHMNEGRTRAVNWGHGLRCLIYAKGSKTSSEQMRGRSHSAQVDTSNEM